jgi:GrpB-like predicted nucleotidyltransferase (UPF0157 family)
VGVIQDYDPRWPALYGVELGRVLTAHQEETVVETQHVGSTAVPGLAAKPTIDIAVSVQRLPPDPASVREMTRIGYEYRGEAWPDDCFFRRGYGYPALFTVHVVSHGSDRWSNLVAIREYLRTHPDEAARYESLKRRLAEQCEGHEAEFYAKHKAPFVEEMIVRASQWWHDPLRSDC